MKNKLCTIYLVRHGQTDWNVKKIMQGQQNIPLNDTGREQAKSTGETLKHIQFDAIYSSDLLRATQTAEILKLERNLEIVTTQLIRERSFGKFEGRKYHEFDEYAHSLFDEYQNLSLDAKWKYKYYEDFESDEEFSTRVITFLREISVAHAGKKILVVSHHGAIGMFLTKVGYVKYDGHSHPVSISNSGYVKVESDGTDFFVTETVGVTIKE